MIVADQAPGPEVAGSWNHAGIVAAPRRTQRARSDRRHSEVDPNGVRGSLAGLVPPSRLVFTNRLDRRFKLTPELGRRDLLRGRTRRCEWLPNLRESFSSNSSFTAQRASRAVLHSHIRPGSRPAQVPGSLPEFPSRTCRPRATSKPPILRYEGREYMAAPNAFQARL
jgi:hypothetical protein